MTDAVCACLDSGPRYPDIADQKHLGLAETDGRFTDVTLMRCARCRRLWLKYLVEREYYTSAGKWAKAPIGEDEAETMTPEKAAAFLDAAEWVVVGGSAYGHRGGRPPRPHRRAGRGGGPRRDPGRYRRLRRSTHGYHHHRRQHPFSGSESLDCCPAG
jgi:hypothetical protein